MSQILALIYYNGRVFKGKEGVMFEGENKVIYIKRDCSFDEMKKRVHKKLNLSRSQVISKVRARLWEGDTPLKYTGASICDDEDMIMMMDRYNEDSHKNVIELYFDITKVGGSSTPEPSQRVLITH